MGTGIAQLALSRGCRVILSDSADAATDRARASIAAGLEREVEKGRLPPGGDLAAMGRLETKRGDSSGSLGDCDLVIEAAVERLDVKQAIFRALEAAVRPDCALATNTSSLSVTAIAAGCERAERVLGLHFFNPAPVMPLVEVIPGAPRGHRRRPAPRSRPRRRLLLRQLAPAPLSQRRHRVLRGRECVQSADLLRCTARCPRAAANSSG
jgi:3-hydroxyacyl-CoA dehydrogenase